MDTIDCLVDLRSTPCSPITLGNGIWPGVGRVPKRQPPAKPIRRRYDRVTIGFWLGGFTLGLGGCILGASLPYSHPVGVTISVLWWGIYLGCFGASIGALFGLLTKRRSSSSRDGSAQPPRRHAGSGPVWPRPLRLRGGQEVEAFAVIHSKAPISVPVLTSFVIAQTAGCGMLPPDGNR
jgi:hypothetical protein